VRHSRHATKRGTARTGQDTLTSVRRAPTDEVTELVGGARRTRAGLLPCIEHPAPLPDVWRLRHDQVLPSSSAPKVCTPSVSALA
jgi:hypothetical protein